MLATLPAQYVFDIANQKNRIFSLIRTPIFGQDTFSASGQGPEKPVIEQSEVEEELFTFPYPGERRELSDIVNPPVGGIVGEVLHSKSKANENFSTRTSSDILFYVFVNPNSRGSIKSSEPEFVSLTRQSAIASSYIGLLVYSTYAVSNAGFSYTSNDVYESPSFTEKAIFYRSDKPLYKNNVPMPIFSGRVYYQIKGRDKPYVRALMQPKLQIYQPIQQSINIKPFELSTLSFSYQDNIRNSDLKLNFKVNYETPQLELHLVRAELPVLDINVENNENGVFLPLNLGFDDFLLRDKFITKLNKRVTEVEYQDTILRRLDYKVLKLELPLVRNGLLVLDKNINTSVNKGFTLNEHSYKAKDFTVPIRQSSLNTVVIRKYNEARVNYKAVKNVVKLPVNLGFDDTLLRNRFIVRLKSQAKEVDYQNVNNAIRMPDIKLDTREYANIRKVDVVQVRSDLRYREDDIIRRQDELESKQYLVTREVIPKPNYKIIQSDFTLERAQPQRIVEIEGLTGSQHDLNFLEVDDSLLIKGFDNFDAQLIYNLDFDLESSDNNPRTYERARVNLDPYGLFSLGDSETQTNYHGNLEVRDVLLPNTEYRTNTRIGLDTLVRVNYDNRVQSLSGTTANSYNLGFIDRWLQVQLQQGTEDTLVVNSGYEGIAFEQDLEEVIEQEEGLIEEEQNVQAEVYDDNIVHEGVYEKSEVGGEQETETNDSSDSPVAYLAAAAGAIGVGVLGGVAGVVGELFKREDDEAVNSNKSDKRLYDAEEEEAEQNCKDTPQCFADTIEWLEGRLRNLTLTDEEYDSISQCYAEEIKNIQKAREHIKKREGGYSCGGALYNLFHHIGFTAEQEEKYKLGDYIRDGEVQEGFKLATTIIAEEELEGNYDIEAIWVDDQKGGQSEKVTSKKSSAYTQLDISLRKQDYTPVWRIMSYIDTETGEKRSGLYLETIAELHLEAKESLGDKDEYGMNLMGLILLVNGKEPGKGTVSMHDYDVKSGDKIDVVFKNDSAEYDGNRQLISNKEIKVDSANYPETKKSPEKVLEPARF